MKGQAAVAAVIIIVIAIVVLFVYFGQGGISLPGFTGAQEIVYNNAVVTVTDKMVSDRVPFDGQKTTIEFTVRNNGKGEVKGVSVSLEPPTGFTSSLKCGDASSAARKCTFDMDEGDATDVLITLTALEGITQILPVDVRYSVEYKYSGEREVHIPVVGDRDDPPRGQTFFTGDSSIGPLQISVTPPPARQTADGRSAVFAVSGIPFKLDFSISDVGGVGTGSVEPVVLKGNQLTLETSQNLKIIFCDKIDADTKALKDDEEVPFDESCRFEATGAGGEVADSSVKIKLNEYAYKISLVDSFTIVPRESRDVGPLQQPAAEAEEPAAEEEPEKNVGSGGQTARPPSVFNQ